MNTESPYQSARIGAYAIGIVGTFAIMGLLVWLMRSYTAGPSPEETRAAERMQIKQQFNADNGPLLTKYDWQDQSRGIVRIPIERAKELILEEWQDPAAGRSNLMARAEKAFAPAPKPPVKKNEYE